MMSCNALQLLSLVYMPRPTEHILTSDSIFGSTKLTDDEDGKFTLRVTPDMTIHNYDWGKSSLNYDDIELAYGSDNSIDADLLLHDLDLPGAIVGRRLTIEFKLTDADKPLHERNITSGIYSTNSYVVIMKLGSIARPRLLSESLVVNESPANAKLADGIMTIL